MSGFEPRHYVNLPVDGASLDEVLDRYFDAVHPADARAAYAGVTIERQEETPAGLVVYFRLALSTAHWDMMGDGSPAMSNGRALLRRDGARLTLLAIQ